VRAAELETLEMNFARSGAARYDTPNATQTPKKDKAPNFKTLRADRNAFGV
jgi:hypothetical protein